jgi:hypothetical protein
MLGLISGLLAPCSPGLLCDARSPWNKWRRGVVVLMGLGAVRTRGRRGLPPAGCRPTAYEPWGPSLDPYKRKSHKYRVLVLNTIEGGRV